MLVELPCESHIVGKRVRLCTPVIRGPSGEPRRGLTREYRVLLVNEDYIITDVVVRVPYYDNTIEEPKTLFLSCKAPYIGADPSRMHRVI